MMTAQKMQKILADVTLGVKAPANESAEDAKVRASLTKEVAQIAARGHVVDMPPELP